MSAAKLHTESDLERSLARVVPIIRDRAIDTDRQGTYPFANIKLLHEAGLMTLAIPARLGGFGGGADRPFVTLSRVQRLISAACSSTGQLFGVQNSAMTTLRLLGSDEQLAYFADKVINDRASFCTVASEPEERFSSDGKRSPLSSIARKVDGGWRLTARKSFASGSLGCTYAMLSCTAEDASREPAVVTVIIPAHDPAVTIHDSWDNMGQRATASGRLDVDDGFVPDHHVIGVPGAAGSIPYFSAIFQLSVASNLLGIAQGALEQTTKYLKEFRRPTLGYASAADEPDFQRRIGEMSTDIAAAEALLEQSYALLETRPTDPDAVSQLLIRVYQTRVTVSKVSVDVTSRLFDVCGARATTRAIGMDRFWRNARTLSLHDSIDKHNGIIGRYALGVEQPKIASR